MRRAAGVVRVCSVWRTTSRSLLPLLRGGARFQIKRNVAGQTNFLRPRKWNCGRILARPGKRFYSDKPKPPGGGSQTPVKDARPKGALVRTAEAARDFSYGAVAIAAGVGLVYVLYMLIKRLVSPSGSQSIYRRTSNLVKNDPLINELLGPKLHFYGSGQGARRNEVVSSRYRAADTKDVHVEVMFHVAGAYNKAEVYADVLQKNGTIYSLVVVIPYSGQVLAYNTTTNKFEQQQ
eukprot:TRINITY_DN6610_c0_g1_i4.p1 TRINITY_DN6610_c0_g1~~TRINITY_DN6610_c0_g1_i4.p1  ORF type:complete len:244 (-),score=30.07 TRINITY_DN6610_c0_g1_i4:306-1010(-)